MNPNINIQELLNGANLNGSLPDGNLETVVSGTPTHGGIISLEKGCSVGGRVDVGIFGATLYGIGGELPGVASFSLMMKDRQTLYPDDTVPTLELLDSTATDFTDAVKDVTSFFYAFKKPVMILPQYSVEFVANAVLSGVGRLYFHFGPGFGRGAGYVSIVSK